MTQMKAIPRTMLSRILWRDRVVLGKRLGSRVVTVSQLGSFMILTTTFLARVQGKQGL